MSRCSFEESVLCLIKETISILTDLEICQINDNYVIGNLIKSVLNYLILEMGFSLNINHKNFDNITIKELADLIVDQNYKKISIK